MVLSHSRSSAHIVCHDDSSESGPGHLPCYGSSHFTGLLANRWNGVLMSRPCASSHGLPTVPPVPATRIFDGISSLDHYLVLPTLALRRSFLPAWGFWSE